jgi:hypothetical protein
LAVKELGTELITHFHLVPRLRLGGTIPPLPLKVSQHVYGQLYLYFYLILPLYVLSYSVSENSNCWLHIWNHFPAIEQDCFLNFHVVPVTYLDWAAALLP